MTIQLKRRWRNKMKRTISIVLSLALISFLFAALAGCGQEIKAENEKLKAENETLKADIAKMKVEVQKMKDELQKAAEKDVLITTLTDETTALKKELEDLKAKMPKAPAKKAPAKK
jgi:predicted RNase H-like nuclease (RuvC/YqgF family)